MKTYLMIGSSPWGETCAQVGSDGYSDRAQAECRAFKNQLTRHITESGQTIPDGFKLVVRSHQHDFGTYYDVGAEFEEENEAASELAFFLEAHTPELWDTEARGELPAPVWPFGEEGVA